MTAHQLDALAKRVRDLEARVERLDQAAKGRLLAPAVSELIDFVGDDFGFTPTEIIAHRRLPEPAAARNLVAWLAKQLTTYSFPRIGLALGGRDHSTIISAIKRVEEARETDPAYRRMTDELRTRAEAFLQTDQQEAADAS